MALKRILVQAGHSAPREPGHLDATGTTREQELTRGVRRAAIGVARGRRALEPILPPEIFRTGSRSMPASSYTATDTPIPPRPATTSDSPFCGQQAIGQAHWTRVQQDPGPSTASQGQRHGGRARVLRVQPHGYGRPRGTRRARLPDESDRAGVDLSHLDELAKAEYVALCGFFGFEPKGQAAPAPAFFIVEWTDAEGDEHRKRR